MSEGIEGDIPMSRLSDWIRTYDDGIPHDLCDKLISIVDNNPDIIFNETWRRGTGSSSIDLSSAWDYLKNTINTLFKEYKNDVKCSDLNHVGCIEAPLVLKYKSCSDKGEYFNLHSDNWSMNTASRQLSVIAYLNDVEEGGETQFVNLNMSVRPKKGRVLFFPPFYSYQHQGNSPISNDKYIAVTWMHFKGSGHSYRTYPL
jgi:prolyl 4-hydroxylase